MLLQLYSHPMIGDMVLQVDETYEEAYFKRQLEENKSISQDSIFYQFQRIFAHLRFVLPTWAGGSGQPTGTDYDSGWQPLNISAHGTDNAVSADLSSLQGLKPTAVRYAWGVVSCCNTGDPLLYVSHPCGPASCPIMASSGLPANPFVARIVDGKCECIKPQICS